ncbi:GntR family transcriptional regulator [Salisediminibacterium halotolerans]|uniref:DNA-binding transcriptional regulator, GntR family n=1 Tax=Salisediminibacterium halotolerans TaxID=517425 RepID=A0A1H9UBA5_9BACI|nr:GntR family transcriptional regulator [Salisediminibacterium haloalkalitolerans]SES06622.1 DNA-binding transcriptional regulator, GntR family [Salisediminibacterium haloalkalitolerans]
MKKVGKFVSYTDQVYREIKGAIISQDIQPKETIQERSIAEQLGVSRTPVREALKKLEYEGWLETIPWKGVVVKDVEMQDMVEVFQCRLANEGFVVRLVAPIITNDQIEDLMAIQTKMNEIKFDSPQEFIHEDRHFHMYLAQLTNNRRLIQFLDHLSDQMIRLGIKVISDRSRIHETLAEHQAIIDALRERSSEKAYTAVETHMNRTEERLLSMIKEGGDK